PAIELDPVIVEAVLETVLAVGDRLDLPPGQRLRPREQLLDIAQHALRAVGGKHLAKPDAAEASGGDLRHEIAREDVGQADVPLEQTEQVLVHLALAEELSRR